jgi:hypothetical protein
MTINVYKVCLPAIVIALLADKKVNEVPAGFKPEKLDIAAVVP